MSDKVVQVADSLHYVVTISALEKRLISTQIFNRLHNVLQDSTAYLTYPSNRQSRFSHSMGCAHLAGEIFRNSLVNATADDRHRFLNELYLQVLQLRSEDSFTGEISSLIDGAVLSRLDTPNVAQLLESLYSHALPGHLTDDHLVYAYLVGLQTVRIAGLLHDLGHPPFSHVLETVLGELQSTILDIPEGDLTDRQRAFKAIYQDCIARGGSSKIHESLGVQLADTIMKQVVRELTWNAEKKLFAIIVKHLLHKAFRSTLPIFKALHSIVDGDLDADRLDFVSRDTTLAGWSKDPFQYNRLLNSFQLLYSCSDSHGDGLFPEFLPRAQALSSIEEFFRRRLDLYRFVIYHHRVVKTDALLSKVVTSIGEDYLRSSDRDSTRLRYRIPKDISGLWRTLDNAGHITGWEFANHYTQWDDPWVITVLRENFFERLEARPSADETRRNIIHVRLEEFLSNKKYYYSLYKRVDTFTEIDESLLLRLNEDGPTALPAIDWNRVRRDAPSIRTLYSELQEYIAAASSGTLKAALRQERGFFTVLLVRFMRAFGESGTRLEFIGNAVEVVRREFDLTDALYEPKELKPGLTSQFRVIVDDQPVELRNLSSLASILDGICRLFPPFFVYVYKESGLTEPDLARMRKRLGQELWISALGVLSVNEMEDVDV